MKIFILEKTCYTVFERLQGILNGITQPQLWKGTVDISSTYALLVPSPICLLKEC